MSWQDRDYNADSAGGGLHRFWRDARIFLPPPATLALVVVHVIAYWVVLAMGYGRSPQAAVPLALSSGYLSPYGVLAHPIAANSGLISTLVIIAIWTAGGAIENLIGPNRLFTLYVVGNVFAGVGYVAVAGFLPHLAVAPLAVPLGAWMAWLMLVLRQYPYEILSIFGFTVRVIRFMGALLAVAALAALFRFQAGAAALLAAGLTAAGAAYVLETLGARVTHAHHEPERRAPRRPMQGPPEMEFLGDDEEEVDDDAAASINVDDLLEKISRSGIDSLTPEERARLEQARQERLRKEDRSHVR